MVSARLWVAFLFLRQTFFGKKKEGREKKEVYNKPTTGPEHATHFGYVRRGPSRSTPREGTSRREQNAHEDDAGSHHGRGGRCLCLHSCSRKTDKKKPPPPFLFWGGETGNLLERSRAAQFFKSGKKKQNETSPRNCVGNPGRSLPREMMMRFVCVCL